MTTVGLIAGVLTTGCWLPQVLRSWRTRSTKDLSWVYLIVIILGITLWGIYGVLRADVAIILANSVTLGFLGFLVVIKATSERRPKVPV